MSHLVCPYPCQTENNTWDVAAGLPTIIDASGLGSYVYGLDLISWESSFYSYDGLGSTTDVTDSSGAVIATYSYDTFGAVRTQSGIPIANEWLFTGEQRDYNISSLYYLRARFYDSATGRFLSQDPVPTENLYAYVGNNPTNFVDPSGLCHEGPLVILKGEKGRDDYAPIFTSEEEEVGFETFGNCLLAHECDLSPFERKCIDPCEKRFAIGPICVADCDECIPFAKAVQTAIDCVGNPNVRVVAVSVGTAFAVVYLAVTEDPVGAAATGTAATAGTYVVVCGGVVVVTMQSGVNPLHP
jgi:RHS repeat-associated protein